MKEKGHVLDRIENLTFIRAIRSGLVMIIPVLMTGSFALILRSFPVDAYQSFIASFASGLLYNIFSLIYNATFGMLSVYMSVAIGYSMTKESRHKCVNAFGAPMCALGTFLISIGFLSDSFDKSALSAVGMFMAIICGTLGSTIYIHICTHVSAFRIYSDGADHAFNRAVYAIMPVAVVLALFSVFNSVVIILSDAGNAWALFVELFNKLFSHFGENFAGGLIYILLSSLFWFFGIHGSDVLEGVNQNIFEPAARLNEQLAAAGSAPTEIFTKTFFDVFVLMGGCGTLLSLLIALLLFSRRKSNRALARMAAFPMLFNINELMVFGLPIIYNPIMLIPFIAAPLASFLISSAAMALGIVPLTSVAVEWTTPIILGGIQATGSFAGALLQLVNLAVGVFIYMPFVRLYDRVKEDEARKNIGALISVLKDSEARNQSIVLTELDGIPGDISKQLVNDLRRAISRGEPYMNYQPQFNSDGKMIGAEALMRWRHSVFGVIYPPLVIKLAEESGMLTELEKYIFKQVKGDAAEFGSDIIISINSTSLSIRDESFTDFLMSEFPDAHAGNSRICIEITEQTELITDTRISETFRKLKAHGFLLAIDDFSMGFTSLKYLSENHFDQVKLDGSLVRGMDNPRNRDIIASIVYLSQSLGFSVLAEFVETAEQRDQLAAIGCLEYQGYLYSPAIPVDKLKDFKEK